MMVSARIEALLLAALALSGGEDGCEREPGKVADKTEQTATTPPCACPLDTDCDLDAGRCVALRLGQRAGDACGPSGEGAIPYAECDPNRGLRCTAPPAGQLDAPRTCQCAAGQTFSPEQRACTGTRQGEHEGDLCTADACNAMRGLVCRAGACRCAEGSWCADSARCIE